MLALPCLAGAQEPAAADSAAVEKSPEHPWALGASGGIPQIIAFTVERRVARGVRVQGNVGSVLVVNSICARVIAIPEGLTFSPYLYFGGGYYFTAFDLESSDDSAFYTWWGGGVRLRIKRLLLFAEVGDIDELDGDPSEISYASAAGILFEF